MGNGEEGGRWCEKGSVVEGQWHLFGVHMLAGHSCICAAALDPLRHWPTRPRGGRGRGHKLHQSRLTTAAKLLEQPLWIAPFHELRSLGADSASWARLHHPDPEHGQNTKNATLSGR
jgi:hypothetical protein